MPPVPLLDVVRHAARDDGVGDEGDEAPSLDAVLPPPASAAESALEVFVSAAARLILAGAAPETPSARAEPLLSLAASPCGQAAALLCGGELLLFSAADDFRTPLAALPLRRLLGGRTPSSERYCDAPHWRSPLLAWSPPARAGDPPALALAAAGIVRIMDAAGNALASAPLPPGAHAVGLVLAPAGSGEGGGLGGSGLRCAVLCRAFMSLLLLEGPGEAATRLPLGRWHGVPGALVPLAPRGREGAAALLVVGDVASAEPTATLWAWPPAGGTGRVRCVAVAGARPRGARRRRAAAALLSAAAAVSGPASTLGRRLEAVAPQPLRCAAAPDARAAAFADAAGGLHLLRVTSEGGGGDVSAALAFVPIRTQAVPPAADAAFWGPDALMLSGCDASARVVPLRSDPSATDPSENDDTQGVPLPGVAALAALPPHAGGARRCLAACAGPDARPGSYRLLTLHERTPGEAVRALTSCGDWDAALAAAAAHGLDDAAVTAVHAARCAAEMPRASTAAEALALLEHAPDRRWAAAAAAAAAPRDAAAARAVIAAGLEDTARLCLQQSQALPDAAAVAAMLSDPPRVAALRLRLALLRAAERLSSLEAVHGAGCGAGPAFAALRDGLPAAAAAAFAAAGAVRAAEALLRRHRSAILASSQAGEGELASSLGAVLDAFPPTMPPADYAAVMPWAPLWLRPPPPGAVAGCDWAECTAVAAALAAAASRGDAEAQALRCATEAMATAAQEGPPAPPSALWAARWVVRRAIAIDAAAGALRHAEALAAAAHQGLPALAAASGEASSPSFLEAFAEVASICTAAGSLAAAAAAGAAPTGEPAMPWELLPLSAFAAAPGPAARLALLLQGAAPDNAPRALAAAAAYLSSSGADATSQGAVFADWARICAERGGIETVSAMFCAAAYDDDDAAAALHALLPSRQALAAAGLAALFASRRAEASALDACTALAAALPSECEGVAEASDAVEAARLLAAHSGAAPSPADVRAAGGDAAAAAALVRRLAARLAARAEPPGDAAWSAAWRDLAAAAEAALTRALPYDGVARLYLLHGPLATRPPALAVARRVLATLPPDAPVLHGLAVAAATRRLARTPPAEPEAATPAACDNAPDLSAAPGDAAAAAADDDDADDDAAAFDDAEALLALAPDSADARAACDAIAALRLLPSLGVVGPAASARAAAALLPQLRVGPAAALRLVAAALAARPRAWQAAGPLLELGRLLGLRRGPARAALQLAIAEAAAAEAGAEGMPPPQLARELCLALARARHAPAAPLAATIALREEPPPDGANAAVRRELLAFAMCHAEPKLLSRLLSAWQALQCTADDDECEEDAAGRVVALPLRGAAAAAYAAAREGLVPDDDVSYALALACDVASPTEAVPDAGAVIALALAPTPAPTAAAIAELGGAGSAGGAASAPALALGIAAHALRAAIAAAEAARADAVAAGGDAVAAEAEAKARIIKALASPAASLLAELDACADKLPPAASAAVSAARALAARQSAAADGAALAAVAPGVDAVAFAAADADARRAVLLGVAADCGVDDDVGDGGGGLPPALAAAAGLATSAGLARWDLAWARAVALLTWRDGSDGAIAHALPPLRQLLHERAGDVISALPRDVWPALPMPLRAPRAAAYLRELAAAAAAAGDESAATRARRAADAAVALGQVLPAADVAAWIGADGGAPPGGAAPALAAAAAAGPAAARDVAEVVAALPSPPDGLTPSAALAAAALRALLQPRAIGGDDDVAARWSAAQPLLAHSRVAAAAAAAVPAAAALGAPPPPSLGAAASAGTGATAAVLCAAFAAAAPRRVRSEMLRSALDRFTQTKGDNKNLAALAARAAAAMARLEAVHAAQAAWAGWTPPELVAIEAPPAAAAAGDVAKTLHPTLTAAAGRGAPFAALRAAAGAAAAAAAATSALDAALAALATPTRPGAPPAALRRALACLAASAPGDDALGEARAAAAASLAAFAAGPAPPAARVAALEALTALPVTWHGWTPPQPPEAPSVAAAEVLVVIATPAPVEAEAAVSPPPTPPPVEEAALPDALALAGEGAASVPAPTPSAPLITTALAPEAAPPAPVAKPTAAKVVAPVAAFDAAAALLAARSAAALESAGCCGCDVAPADVASTAAAAALLARVLALQPGAGSIAAGVALVALWEASAPWGAPLGADPSVPRPLCACWAALASAAVTRADDAVEVMLIGAADKAAAGGIPPLLDEAAAAAVVAAAAAPEATHAGLRAAAAMALLCHWSAPRAAAAAALQAAAEVAEAISAAAVPFAVPPRLALLLAAADALPAEPNALLRAVAASAARALMDDCSAVAARPALLLLTHAAARLAASRRHAAAVALLLAAARAPAAMASLEGGLALAQRVFTARARAQPPPEAPLAPGTRGTASAAAMEAMEAELPQRCAAAAAALAADLRS